MKSSLKTGFSFGLTSGIITTLGLMVGLNAGTHSKLVVLGGILTIAIADAMSDALGIHISEESEGKHSVKEVWESTLSTFFTKFIFALTFVIPVLLFELSTAMVVAVFWGLLCLGILSYYVAKKGEKIKVILEHLLIAVVVIIATHLVGKLINGFLG
jgi:vacuolar iron transporter family protein